ncbi:MAG: cyclodeaminase/cyclohydrolase family protein [Oscillospiraceae bacterium]|nr:cyclodeaminase/cyclohydrolase family protein [Oscillospiraceae bacterium]
MTEFKNLTVEQFVSLTASDAPAPGGGSVTALVASLGAALAEMVANLTVGKEKYADADAQMREVAAQTSALRAELVDGIQKDVDSFTAYMTALRMPKDTEEQKAARQQAMQRGLKTAALVPLDVAKTAVKIFPLAQRAVQYGNPMAVTDGLAAAMLARSAVLGALLNVKINLASIKDEAFVSDISAQVKQLEKQAITLEKQVLDASSLTDTIFE